LVTYTVELDESEAKQIAHRAEVRGYPSLLAYLRALVAADELVMALRDDWQDADASADTIELSFRESWHEAMTGKTLPIDRLWDSLDDE
jgi:hypothetical protein